MRCRRRTKSSSCWSRAVSAPELLLPADRDELAITPESAGWTYCGLHIVRLDAGEERHLATAGDEFAVLPLAGSATVEVDGQVFELEGRASVFARVTDWAYVPIESDVRVTSVEGFALHRTYTTDGSIDETVVVRDGDAFLVPRGYHGPTVAAPGYPLYYLNVMAGPNPERTMAIVDDPPYAWVRGSWEGMAVDPRCPLTSADGAR